MREPTALKSTSIGLLVLLATTVALALKSTQGPAHFDAASIKPAGERHDPPGVTRPAQFGIRISPGRFTATAVSARQLILTAYDLRPYQLSGGPEWLDTDLYTVVASTATPAARPELIACLRTLLQDRFGLKLASESRAMQVYALVPGPSGLRPRTEAPDASGLPRWQNWLRLTGGREVADLIQNSGALDHPVIDKSGAADTDRFYVLMSADPTCESQDISVCGGVLPHGDDLRRMLRDQAGLELRLEEDPVPVFRVSAVTRPTAD